MNKIFLIFLLFYSISNGADVNNGLIGKYINENTYKRIDTITITVSQKNTVYGFLFDADNNIISDSSLNNSIRWEICKGDSLKINLNRFGNKTTIASNYAYTEYLVKMTYNDIPLDTICVRINPSPSYKICIDTVINSASSINQITIMADLTIIDQAIPRNLTNKSQVI